jgi:Flp pilus assembly protein TadD
MYPEALFNRGLRAARAGDSAFARECFAAVALWHPEDLRTRNAHALACLDARDVRAAMRGWQEVLASSPGDSLAARGLATLAHHPG